MDLSTFVPWAFSSTSATKDLTTLKLTSASIKALRTCLTESLIFSCSQDGFKTEHSYPRGTPPNGDPVVGLQTGPTEVDCNYISFYVGVSTAGGLVAPLQMEFLASILENSNA